jgi:hypothetical protein
VCDLLVRDSLAEGLPCKFISNSSTDEGLLVCDSLAEGFPM